MKFGVVRTLYSAECFLYWPINEWMHDDHRHIDRWPCQAQITEPECGDVGEGRPLRQIESLGELNGRDTQ